MKTSTKHALWWSVASAVIGLVTPGLVLLWLEVAVGGTGPLAAMADILSRQVSLDGGDSLLLLNLVGLIPFAPLAGACFLFALRLTPARLACVAIGGLLGILGLMVPFHYAVWYPTYAHEHQSSTAVLAFLVIPFFCLPTLLIGLLVGWLVSLLPYFRHATKVT
ncbi:MAG: hypothetical protein WAO00_08315 [Chthoniobacterales bacterium]